MPRRVSKIEEIAASFGLVPKSVPRPKPERLPDGTLSHYPPFEKWGSWEELDAARRPRRYSLVPTTCFNCEAACGLLAYIDQDSGEIERIEGNPLHPGSRGRNCAKGPATLNQIRDPERILTPLKRVGPRGTARFEPCSWDEALDAIAARIRAAISEGRGEEVMYHVGRPGHEAFMERLLSAWGIDGHNSHTTVCSGSARAGYQLSWGYDRPSPDYENAQLILLISAHLESGHYFNPHAQRIIDAKERGARVVVLDPRLSNTASRADLWLSTRPGTEAAVILAALRRILLGGRGVDRAFVEDWVDWRGYLRNLHPELSPDLDLFLDTLAEDLAEYTPEAAAELAGIAPAQVIQLAEELERAGPRVAAHIWRAAASGNEGGWQIARALCLLTAMVGAVGAEGGTSPSAWHKYKPQFWTNTEGPGRWNELIWPEEYPLSFYEMSHILPHLVHDGRGRIDTYFTRVFNPVWTYPDGFSWMEMLRDESKVGCYVALTPTWNETAYFADFVLPMGHATERHDIQSMETHAGRWVSFRQPVQRARAALEGRSADDTRGFNPGEVWEEDEFWIELTWRIDPDGSMGIRRHYESPYRPGEKVTVDEYYRWIFENAVPGLPEKAKEEGLEPLDYMRRVGSFEMERGRYRVHETKVDLPEGARVRVEATSGLASVEDKVVGVAVDGAVRQGFPTPSRKIEIFSRTLAEWGYADAASPRVSPSHVGPHEIDPENGVYTLVPTFRLPTMIHSRSGNAKHLNEISHANPVWIHPDDADRHSIGDGDLVKVETTIGYFINRARVTDGIRPGVLCCSHHMGRWRVEGGAGSRWSSATVRLEPIGESGMRLRICEGNQPFASSDPDSGRTWWKDAGVHQNLTFPPQSDPVSGMNCWHQVVRLSKAGPSDRYGDVFVDLEKSREMHHRWLAKARKPEGALRRPEWLPRPLRPRPEAYRREV